MANTDLLWRRWRHLFAFALVLLLLGWRLPGLLESLQLNRVAIASASGCGHNNVPGGEWRPQTPRAITPAQAAWFKVIQTRCTGDDNKAREAMSEVLAASDARLDTIHAMAKDDVALARIATTTHPKLAGTQFWLGDALARQGDDGGAIQAYEHGLALQNSDPDLQNNEIHVWMMVGSMYEEEGNLQAAVKAYEQACRWVDIGDNGCQNAGETYLRLGLYELAAERFQTSLEQMGHAWPPAEKGLVKALMALGRTKEAVPHLQILAAQGSVEAEKTLQQIQETPK
jgi:tetratricopeptide (TPR) repeat protein